MAVRILIVAILFVLYTYVLYPLIIVALGRLRKRPPLPESGDRLPSVTIVIVSYNEEGGIANKIENCRELDYPDDLLTVCIVSDGSTDRTNEILGKQGDIRFIQDDINRGKPHQINKAVRQCDSDVIVFSDSRQMFGRDAISKLVRSFTDPSIGAVSGELVFRSPRDHTERSIGLYWRYEKILRKAESAVDSTLGATGAIYAIRRELFEPIPGDTILDDIEIPLRAFRKGYRIAFDDEAAAYDSPPAEIAVEFRRKVRTLAGNFQLFNRNLWLLNPFKNRIFMQAVSHKLFRLFIPYALACILVVTGIEDGSLFRMLFWIQVFFYLVGLAALKLGGLRRNRLINVISVFLSMNAASVVALYRYWFNKIDVTWRVGP